jgi:hypothetical protein
MPQTKELSAHGTANYARKGFLMAVTDADAAAAIEDQKLVSDQHGFGGNGTESARPLDSRAAVTIK